jgi:molecular chaperone GrpE
MCVWPSAAARYQINKIMPTDRTEHDQNDQPDPEPAERGTERVKTAATGAPASAQAQDLASQLEEANGRYLRLAADFENFKKRARQEQVETMRYAAAALAERLLPVLDDAERAMAHVPEGVEEGWLKGLQMTVRKLEEILGSVGVERIEAEGKPFDPNLHEAIGSEESEDTDEDTVTAELRPGYRMHDRVLRPALVRVSRRPG